MLYYRGYRIIRVQAGYYNIERRLAVSWTGATRYVWVWSYETLKECKAAINNHLGV